MLKEIKYDRKKALEYAKEWAFKRNPKYLNFENIGGDCTSYVSQCVYAGCQVVNYTPIYGWYYKSSYDRSPSWSGVEFLFNFLVNNKSTGPFAIETDINHVEPADIIQLGNINGQFYHNVFINKIEKQNIFVSAHSVDSYMRPLNNYNFDKLRYIHILGARKNFKNE